VQLLKQVIVPVLPARFMYQPSLSRNCLRNERAFTQGPRSPRRRINDALMRRLRYSAASLRRERRGIAAIRALV
jgi:hypothetical protein